jgi:hypothetical protein
VETILPALRSERDTLFGPNATDVSGLWYWLTQYKANVHAWLGPKHALSKVVPNLGEVTPGDYQKIIQRFVDHWERVNAAGNAMVLGTMTLANLTTKRNDMEAKNKEIRNAELSLATSREEREDLFGDLPDDEREDTSIIARLLQYHAAIPVRFPGQAIAASLPRIFPDESGPAPLRFNWRDLGGGQLKTWVRDPASQRARCCSCAKARCNRTNPSSPASPATSPRRRGPASRWSANWTSWTSAPPTVTRWPTASATRASRSRNPCPESAVGGVRLLPSRRRPAAAGQWQIAN